MTPTYRMFLKLLGVKQSFFTQAIYTEASASPTLAIVLLEGWREPTVIDGDLFCVGVVSDTGLFINPGSDVYSPSMDIICGKTDLYEILNDSDQMLNLFDVHLGTQHFRCVLTCDGNPFIMMNLLKFVPQTAQCMMDTTTTTIIDHSLHIEVTKMVAADLLTRQS